MVLISEKIGHCPGGISDPQKEKETQLEVWRERIRQKDSFGTIKFYAQKLVIANEDGSFSWKWEGNFLENTGGCIMNLLKNYSRSTMQRIIK